QAPRGALRGPLPRARLHGAAQRDGEDRPGKVRDLDRHAGADARPEGGGEAPGLDVDKVTLHTTFLGGGFGRRFARGADYVAEAVHVAKEAGAPVKTVWTREDDMRGGNYRPMFVHRIEAGLDKTGRPVAWRHTVAGTPIARSGTDEQAVEGI